MSTKETENMSVETHVTRNFYTINTSSRKTGDTVLYEDRPGYGNEVCLYQKINAGPTHSQLTLNSL